MCVRDSERVKRVGTAPPSQLLKGATVHNLGVGTTRQEMQNVSKGPTLTNSDDTTGTTSILDMHVS